MATQVSWSESDQLLYDERGWPWGWPYPSPAALDRATSSGRRHFLRCSSSWVGTWTFLALQLFTGTSRHSFLSNQIIEEKIKDLCSTMWFACSQVWSGCCSGWTCESRRWRCWSSGSPGWVQVHGTTTPACWSRSPRALWTEHPSPSAHTPARSLAHTALFQPRSEIIL